MQTETSNRQLVSFVLMAYNQERFVREAIEGALSQTYSPLEIILSDDCSPDSTFEVMKQMASAYRGPHKVILNRNPRNLGIGGHLNRMVELASGDLLIEAGGDDISLPERASRIAQVWEDSGRKATSIHGSWIGIDGDGKTNRNGDYQEWPEGNTPAHRQLLSPSKFVMNLRPAIYGCTHAFSKRLFKVFGPLIADIVFEDKAMEFRSSLIGEIHFVREPLVKYRQHSENTFAPVRLSSVTRPDQFPALDRQLAREFERHLLLYDGFQADVSVLAKQGMMSAQDAAALNRHIALGRRGYELRRKMLDVGCLRRIQTAVKMLKGGYRIRRLLPRLWPRPVFVAYILAQNRLRRFMARP